MGKKVVKVTFGITTQSFFEYAIESFFYTGYGRHRETFIRANLENRLKQNTKKFLDIYQKSSQSPVLNLELDVSLIILITLKLYKLK